jgi:hypothetical protein
VDIRSDIYSLGATLYHLATGQIPFEGSTAAVVMTKHLNEQLPWPQDINPNISDGTCALIEKMMAKPREERYASPTELVRDLELVISGQAPATPRPAEGVSSVAAPGSVRIEVLPGESRAAPARRVETRFRDTRKTAQTVPVQEVGGAAAFFRKPAVLAGSAAAAAALLVVGIAVIWSLATGGDETPPQPPTPPTPPIDRPDPPTPPPPTPPKPDPDNTKRAEELEKMFEYANTWWQQNPTRYAQAVGKFRKVESEAKGTRWQLMAGDAIKEVESAWALAADGFFKSLRKRAEERAKGEDFDGALAVLRTPLPPEHAERLAGPVKAETARVNGQARAKLDAGTKQVEKLARENSLEEAFRQLAALEKVRYSAYAPKLRELRTVLERQKQLLARSEEARRKAEAARLLVTVLERFDAAVGEKKYDEAAKLLSAEVKRADAQVLELVAAEFSALQRVLDKMRELDKQRASALAALKNKAVKLRSRTGAYYEGKILTVDPAKRVMEIQREYVIMGQRRTRKTTLSFEDLADGELERVFKEPRPDNADGFVGEAVAALAAGDLATARTALERAGGHPLHPHYASRLADTAKGAGEAAAKRAWEGEVSPLIKEKLSVEDAEKLLAALKAFSADHSESAFARDRGAEIEKLRFSAEAALRLAGRTDPGSEPEPAERLTARQVSERVNKMFKAKVVGFNPQTLAVELFWDFSDPAHVKDFVLPGNDWSVVDGALRSKGSNYSQNALTWAIFRPPAQVTAKVRLDRGSAGLKFRERSNYAGFSLGGTFRPEATLAFTGDYRWRTYARNNLEIAKSVVYGFSVVGDRITGTMDGRPAGKGAGVKLDAFQLQLAASGDNHLSTFDDVRIRAHFDATWLKRQLKVVSARIAGATRFKSEWKKLEIAGGSPSPREVDSRNLAYDTKRRVTVLFGGLSSLRCRHDLWQLDLTARKWTCVQKHDPGGPGLGTSRPDMDRIRYRRRLLYDEAHDVYRTAYMWEYDPKTGKWTEGTGRVDGWDYNSESWWYYSAWAWDPDGKRFLGFGGSRGAMFYPARKTAVRVASGGPSRAYDSAMAYDRATRHFVLFGAGGDYNETWIFSAQANTWRRTHPAESPPGRRNHSMISPDGAKAVVLFGGTERRRYGGVVRDLNDAWVYEPAAERWTKLAPTTGPPSCDSGMVLDRAHDLGVMVNSRGETWTLKVTR